MSDKSKTIRTIIPAQPEWYVCEFRRERRQYFADESYESVEIQENPVVAWEIVCSPSPSGGIQRKAFPIVAGGEQFDEKCVLRFPDGRYLFDGLLIDSSGVIAHFEERESEMKT